MNPGNLAVRVRGMAVKFDSVKLDAVKLLSRVKSDQIRIFAIGGPKY